MLDADQEHMVALAGAHFVAAGEWPEIKQILRELARAGVTAGLERAMWSLPPSVGFREGDRLILTSQGLSLSPAAEPLLNMLVNFARHAAAVYLGTADPPVVTSEGVRDALGLDRTALAQLEALLRTESFLIGSGQRTDEAWTYEIAPRAAQFKGCSTTEDYLAVRRSIVGVPSTLPQSGNEISNHMRVRPLGRTAPTRRVWRSAHRWLFGVSIATVGGILVVVIAPAITSPGRGAPGVASSAQRVSSAGSERSSLVAIEGSLHVARATEHQDYAEGVSAVAGDRLIFQAWYYNRENVDSGRYASNLTVAFGGSSTRGREQLITVRIFGDNTNVVRDGAIVRVPDGHVVRLVSGSGMWRHNAGNDQQPTWVEKEVGDELFGRGAILEDASPCLLCEATVSVIGVVEAA